MLTSTIFSSDLTNRLAKPLLKPLTIAIYSFLLAADRADAGTLSPSLDILNLPPKEATMSDEQSSSTQSAQKIDSIKVLQAYVKLLSDFDISDEDAAENFINQLQSQVDIINKRGETQPTPLEQVEISLDYQATQAEIDSEFGPPPALMDLPQFNLDQITYTEGLKTSLEQILEHELENLGILLEPKILLENANCENAKRICNRLKVLADKLEETHPDEHFNLKVWLMEAPDSILPIVEPEPLLVIKLNRPTPIELHIVDSSTFNSIPSPGERIDPKEIGIAGACVDISDVNMAATLLLDDPKTMDVNEGIEAIAKYIEEKFIPSNSELLEKLGIKDYRRLTPTQAYLLTTAIVMDRLEYSQEQINVNGEDVPIQSWNERTINDNLPIHLVLENDTSTNGNSVCRGDRSCARGTFAGVQRLQVAETSLIHSMRILREGIYTNSDLPGNIEDHGWNEVLRIRSNPSGKGYIVYASAFDCTWADDDEGLDPARLGNTSQELDYTPQRFPLILHRFLNYFDKKDAVKELYLKASEEGKGSSLMKKLADRWYKELLKSEQQEVYDSLSQPPIELSHFHLPVEPDCLDSDLEFKLKDQTKIHPDKLMMTIVLTSLAETHEELFVGSPRFLLAPEEEKETFYKKGQIVLTVEMSEEEIIERLKKHQEFKDRLIEIQAHSDAKILMVPLTNKVEEKIPKYDLTASDVDLLITNLSDYFLDSERQSLLVNKAFTIGRETYAYNGYHAHWSVDLFLGDYNSETLDDILIDRDLDAYREKVEFLNLLRSLEEIETPPGIYGIRVDPKAKNIAEIYHLIKKVYEQLDAESLELLETRPVFFEISGGKAYLENTYDLAVAEKLSGAVQLGPSVYKRQTSLKDRLNGDSDFPDIIIPDDNLDIEEKLKKALEQYIEVLKLRERAEKLGIDLYFRNSEYKPIDEKSIGKLAAFVSILEGFSPEFQDFSHLQISVTDRLIIDGLAATTKDDRDVSCLDPLCIEGFVDQLHSWKN